MKPYDKKELTIHPLSMPQTFSSVWIHLIWATKNRESVLHAGLRFKLYDAIRTIAEGKGYHLDFINGVEDHLHCLISLAPKFSISEVAKQIKGASSRWVNENSLMEGLFEWQDGYAAISVSPSNIQKVRNYIRNQESHHQTLSFHEELEKFKKMTIVIKDK
jgi:putative transposase